LHASPKNAAARACAAPLPQRASQVRFSALHQAMGSLGFQFLGRGATLAGLGRKVASLCLPRASHVYWSLMKPARGEHALSAGAHARCAL
jgi:hypothetical protein